LTDLDIPDLLISQVPSGECDSISTDLYSNYGAFRSDSLREDFETAQRTAAQLYGPGALHNANSLEKLIRVRCQLLRLPLETL